MAVANGLILFPVRFSTTAYVLRVTANAVSEDLNFPASGSLTTGRNYWASNDSQGDADGGVGGTGDLLAMLEATLLSHTQLSSVTVDYNSSFKVAMTFDQTTQILWTHANTTLDSAATNSNFLGFDVTSDSASSTAITSDFMPYGVYRPASPFHTDTRDQQGYAGGTARTLSGLQYTSRIATPQKTRTIGWEYLLKNIVLDEYAETDEPDNTAETLFDDALSLGRQIRVYNDETSRTSTSYALYRDREPMQIPWEQLEGELQNRFHLRLPLARSA